MNTLRGSINDSIPHPELTSPSTSWLSDIFYLIIQVKNSDCSEFSHILSRLLC